MSQRARLAAVFSVALGISLLLLKPALDLPFVSDDLGIILYNEYVHELTAENLAALVDPWGEPARNTANYAPVHLLVHAVEWSLWGPAVAAYHFVNVVLHAAVVTLFVALLVRRGLPFAAAVLAGGLFAVHPAQVEAVVWIFQLKTLLALALAIGALLAHPARPAWGVSLFALALLTKISALFALPVAAVWTWTSGGADPRWRERGRWLLGWAAVALLCALPQFAMFERAAQIQETMEHEWPGALRDVVAIGSRYLVMASTGRGVSPFHEPDPTRSWLDPRVLAGLLIGGLLAWRCAFALTRRREEAAWWVWAAAAYLPISQIFRFLYPMADRYLYFILPGLFGGVAFAARDLWQSAESAARRRGSALPSRRAALRTAAACVVLLGAVFGSLTMAQARVWRSPTTISLATARNYPNGLTAHRMRAHRAARLGDAEAAAEQLRGALERGFDAFMDLQGDRVYAALAGNPAFDEVMRDIAGAWIETVGARPTPTHYELYWLAEAHRLRGELREAEATFVRALELGGDFDPSIRQRLEGVRRSLSQGQGGGRAPTEGD